MREQTIPHTAGIEAGKRFLGTQMDHHSVIREAIDREFSDLFPKLPFFDRREHAFRAFVHGFASGLASAIRNATGEEYED